MKHFHSPAARLARLGSPLLATLALATAAHAQVDGSVYGVADVSWGRFQTAGSLAEHRFNSNSMSASFIGLNVKDTFDGGWTPGLTLETFFRFQDFATGRKPSDPLLSRNAFASLGSPLGVLRLGRTQTLLFDTTARFNALGNAIAFSPAMRGVFLDGGLESVQGDFYWDRAAAWQSPNLDGLLLNAMVAKGAATHRGDYTAANAIWATGLFAGTVSVQRVHVNDGLHAPTIETAWQAGATYNLGLARLFGLGTWTNDVGLGVRSGVLAGGIAVPLGPGTLEVEVARSRARGPAIARRQTSTGAAYVYAVDSLTDFYVAGLDDRVRDEARGWSAAIGVRRRFD